VSVIEAEAEPARTPASPVRPARSQWGIGALVGLCAAIVAFVSMQAWQAGTNDPDSMSSVLYFQRIAAGRHLEATVLTTSKPLLTVVYGLTWNVAHDWRTIVWETILIHGIGVALAARLAMRVAGLPAGLFVASALIASTTQLGEVAQANSQPWALAGWLAAGVAVTSSPPRFGLAGVALLFAGLARIETWLILGVATVGLLLLALPFIRARQRGWPSARSLVPLMVGWLAVPIQLGHDYLLAGDPLYWLSVPRAYTVLVTPQLEAFSPLRFGQELLYRYGSMPVLVLLAAVGVAHLVRTQGWALLIGLSAIIIGGWLLLGSLAVRGIYITARYYEEPGLALLLAAGLGAGVVVSWAGGFSARLRSTAGGISGAGAAMLVAGALSIPGPFDAQLQGRFSALHVASTNLETVMPTLRRVMSGFPGPAPSAVPAGGGFTEVDPRTATMYVPRPLQRRIAIELETELTRLADPTVASRIGPAADLLVPGQYVYHDLNVDVPAAWFVPFEIVEETSLGGLRLLPIGHGQGGYWLVRVEE
jgi:hypothetical protein